MREVRFFWPIQGTLMLYGFLAQFPLQGAAVHVQRPRGGGDGAVMLGGPDAGLNAAP